MSKTKIILISIGSATLLGTLVLAYLIYSAVSASGECAEETEFLETEASRLTRMKVYPGPEAVQAVGENRKAYESWHELAVALASAGDQKFEEKTPASFKADINEEAKRISALPGTVDGRFVKSEFGFGFDEYINKGKLPAAADMPRLQREWYDVNVFVGLLLDAKASSILELTLVKAEVKEVAPVRRNARKRPAEAEAPKSDITRFDIVFTAGPEALVKVLNGIAANARFIVAEKVSFSRTPDALAEKLGERTVKKSEGGRRRSSRRTEERVETPAKTGEAVTGIVTDPATAEDLKVTMRVAVYDFRTRLKSTEAKEEQK